MKHERILETLPILEYNNIESLWAYLICKNQTIM